METWETIRSRRDIREFAERALPDDALRRVLEAGRRAPSSRNWQPWTFVVVTEHDQLRRLADVWQGAGHVARSAATIALVTDDPAPHDRDRLHYDLGQATMQMMLAAADLGVGSGHSIVEDQTLAAQVLGLGPTQVCWYLVPLGWPRRPLRPVDEPDRRSYEQVVRFVGARGGA
jgi:nitroreductase